MVIALALNIDQVDVEAHPLMRNLTMSVAVPPLAAYLLRRRLPPG